MPSKPPIPLKMTEENERRLSPQSNGTHEPTEEPKKMKNQRNHFGTILF
jgi:hypothetical protein